MALFKPNPDRESVEELIESLSQELASRYAGAEDELIREVAARAYRDLELSQLPETAPGGMGLTAAARRRQNQVLAQLAIHRANAIRDLHVKAAQIVDRLRSEEWARRIINLAATEGEAAAVAQLGLAARVPTNVVPIPFIGSPTAISATTLTGTATQAVGALVFSLESRLEALNQRITRYPQDSYQRIVSMHTPNVLLGVSTSRIQQQAAVQRFLSEGITGFVDRGNRRWTIGAYAEMAGRTTVNRAFNDAATWRMGQAGIHLATIVRGMDSCESCASWAGKILSTDGRPAGVIELPHTTKRATVTITVAGTVDQARDAGWNHPNCRCRLVAYLPGVTNQQNDTTYDPEAERERARQRELERNIRAAKRREAYSDPGDRMAQQRAHREVLDAQASMREFLADTGRNRSNYREQLGFADGR